MNRNYLFCFLSLSLLLISPAKSQDGNVPLNLDFDYGKAEEIYSSDTAFTAFKPLSDYSGDSAENKSDKLFLGDILHLKSKKSAFSLNPILHYQFFQEGDESFKGYGAGASMRYSYSDKLSAGIDFAHFSIEYPFYQRAIISENEVDVVPSHNLPGIEGDKVNSQYYSAYINYSPSHIFDFQLGYGRNFIGDGHRSLLLSDHADAYPYFRINTEVWKLKYTNLFSVQNNSFFLEPSLDKLDQNVPSRTKYTATHFLDFKATDWLTIGLFETVVWQRKDTIFDRGFDVHYLNPVIFYRPLEFSTGSADNVLMGLNLKARIAKKHNLYTQMIIDEFLVSEVRADIKQLMSPEEDIQSHWWANKYALQLGWLAFDLFGIEGLKTRLEYNFVRPYMYAHASPDQSYSHQNLPLAHPLGANFNEYLFHLDYYINKWRVHFRYHYSTGGKSLDTLSYGNNVLTSIHGRVKDYEVETGQGLSFDTHYLNTGISYLLQEEWKLYVQLGYLRRSQSIYDTQTEDYVYLKLSTALFNQYFDY